MRKLVIVTLITTIFYLMTGLVFFEGSFEGALVVKPYPTHEVAFGGGEEGIWSRYHPGEPPPWFMQKDLKVIFSFDWEQGRPAWIEVYLWGYLVTLLAGVVLLVIGAVRFVSARARLNSIPLSIR